MLLTEKSWIQQIWRRCALLSHDFNIPSHMNYAHTSLFFNELNVSSFGNVHSNSFTVKSQGVCASLVLQGWLLSSALAHLTRQLSEWRWSVFTQKVAFCDYKSIFLWYFHLQMLWPVKFWDYYLEIWSYFCNSNIIATDLGVFFFKCF